MNSVCCHLYVELTKKGRKKEKKVQVIATERMRVEWLLLGSGRVGEMERCAQRELAFNYKMNRLWGPNIKQDDYSQ